MLQNKYIAIAGNIGAGKSTLVQFLSAQFGATPFYEANAKNPYLSNFYKDMRAWAFHSQIFFLTHKFRIHKELENHKGLVVLDRTIHEDAEIFARALHEGRKMGKADFETYWSLYKAICATLRPPDLMIYLKCSLPTLKKRIALRGRKMESDIPASYLRRLQYLYNCWIEKYNQSELLVIETDKLDYIADLVHRIDIMKKIESFIR